MFKEAENPLQKTDESLDPGQWALISGYLCAAQGRCQEANKHFKDALALGQKCISEEYRLNCRNE